MHASSLPSSWCLEAGPCPCPSQEGRAAPVLQSHRQGQRNVTAWRQMKVKLQPHPAARSCSEMLGKSLMPGFLREFVGLQMSGFLNAQIIITVGTLLEEIPTNHGQNGQKSAVASKMVCPGSASLFCFLFHHLCHQGCAYYICVGDDKQHGWEGSCRHVEGQEKS